MGEFSVTEFVRGLALHDIGKPFALEGWHHARLGYWLLALAGKPEEALTALRHDKEVRNQYFQAKGPSAQVPSVTILGQALDELASAVYSLQTTPSEDECYSLQNPFNRLPVTSDLLKRPFLVTGREDLEKYEADLWESIIRPLPEPWKTVLASATKTQVEDKKTPLPVDVGALPTGNDALLRIAKALADYPERTYPPMNDTTLQQHGRLTGILGFVVYQNLVRDPKMDVLEVMQDANHPGSYRNPAQVVQEHLEASLVRVSWEGLRAWFLQAARIDDMLGTLALTQTLHAAFKRAFAEALGARELAEWLTLSQSQFELYYLVPDNATNLTSLVAATYKKAVAEVSGNLVAQQLQRDFPDAVNYQTMLEQQLASMTYGLRLMPVEVPDSQDYATFAATYGRKLLNAYRDSQDYVLVASPQLLTSQQIEPLPVAETCDVCGTHPVWQPPESLDDEAKAKWLQRRNFAAHIFRGEREQVCVLCAARRELAFGAIAKRLDELVHPMFEQGEQPGLWHIKQPESGPALPPLLAASVDLEAQNNNTDEENPALRLRDAGACFVRYCRTATGIDRDDIDVFPTVSYASDQNGNVVLLVLTPKLPALFGAYSYDVALDKYGLQPLENVTQDEVNWQRAVAAFYHTRKDGGTGKDDKEKTANEGAAAALRTVKPHLARVMERITRIKHFYEALETQLTHVSINGNRPIRVLPLNVEYPTLRLLIPADRLDDALRMLDQVVTETLFSATYATDPVERKAQHKFLSLVTPDLLHGAVILFKHKFPLYLALEAERELLRRLATHDQKDGDKARGRPNQSGWYGFRLAFSDLRGSLSEVGPLDAAVTYAQLGQVLNLVEHVDRPTLLQYAKTWQYLSPELAQAQAVVRADRISRTQVKYVEPLQDKALFDAVYFITRAIRR